MARACASTRSRWKKKHASLRSAYHVLVQTSYCCMLYFSYFEVSCTSDRLRVYSGATRRIRSHTHFRRPRPVDNNGDNCGRGVLLLTRSPWPGHYNMSLWRGLLLRTSKYYVRTHTFAYNGAVFSVGASATSTAIYYGTVAYHFSTRHQDLL